jgi:hypothetical protein
VTRLQILGASAVLVLSVGALVRGALWSPEVPFLVKDGAAVWITDPRPAALDTYFAAAGATIPAVFARTFSTDRAGGPATVAVRALGRVAVELNGHAVPLEPGGEACLKSWCRGDVSPLVVAGTNSLRVSTSTRVSPPVLLLRLAAPGADVVTDERWEGAVGTDGPRPAARADDTRVWAGARETTTPLAALRARVAALLGVFAASAGVFLAGRRFLPAALLPRLALGTLTVVWGFLFVTKFVRVPLDVGYDAVFHVQYVLFVAREHVLPLANAGFSMFHPPLFYALAAALLEAFRAPPGGVLERVLLKSLPFLSGLGMVWITHALACRLWDRRHPATLFAVLVAGTLPLNLYMAAYVSNEPLFAFLVGATLLAASGALTAARVSAAHAAGVAVLLGLAIAAKYTGLVVVPVVVSVVALKAAIVDRVPPLRVAALAAGMVLVVGVVGGWVYARNWIHFGDPVIWNLSLPGGHTYWQLPGYRTAEYYLGFGESLRHPYFSLFHSFWDALYSGIWGEGAPPSVRALEERHGLWSYDLMSAGYLLALPAAGGVALGFGVAVAEALRGGDPGRRLTLSLVTALMYVVLFSVLSLTIRYPYWGFARASYVLVLVVPLALCAGAGLAAVDRWLAAHGGVAARAVFAGWFGTLVVVLTLAFAA